MYCVTPHTHYHDGRTINARRRVWIAATTMTREKAVRYRFFVHNIRVRSGSEISIWHRWRAEGDPSCMRARTLRVAVGEDNVRAAVAAAGVNTPPTAAAAAFSLCCSRLFSVARTHVHATNSRPTLTVRTPLPDHGRDLAPPHTLNEPRSTRQTPIFNYTF